MSLPPPRDFSEFEDLCCDLWRRIWGDPNAKRNGRRGQRQHGVDVFGRRAGRSEGLQCRTKDQMTGSKLVFPELARLILEAENFSPPLAAFTIATTALRDAPLQERIRRLSTSREAEGRFTVGVWFWEDILCELAANHDLLIKYYPEIFAPAVEKPLRVATRKEVENYLLKFSENIRTRLDPWIELTLFSKQRNQDISDLLAALRTGGVLALLGPSGAGKSHLIKHLALQLASDGCASVIVRSKYYKGDFPSFLDGAIGHITLYTFDALIAGCKSTQIPLILFVDGLNETGQAMREDLVDKLLQLKLRKENLSILVTTRHEVAELERLNGSVVNLSLPSTEQRAKLCKTYGVPERVADSWSEVIRTPFDVKLAGEIAEVSITQPLTQYSFLHAYLEGKLGHLQDVSFSLLTEMASRMSQRLTWVLPRTEVHRLVRRMADGIDLLTPLFDSAILAEAVEHVSFWHERFQHFFQAESLLTKTDAGDLLGDEIGRPRNRDALPLVVSTLQDSIVIRTCLYSVRSPETLFAVLRGELGPFARAVLEIDAREVLTKAKKELDRVQIRLRVSNDRSPHEIRAEGIENWSERERCLLAAVGCLLRSGPFLTDFLDLLQASEARCVEELKSLQVSKRHRYSIVLRFLLIGTSPQALSVTHIYPSLLLLGVREGKWSGEAEQELMLRLTGVEREKPAILFLLCQFCREKLWDDPDPNLVSELPGLIQACKDWGIYHLDLEAIQLAESAGQKLPRAEREKVEEILNSYLGSDPLLNSVVFEALTNYTEVDVGVSLESALVEIRSLLRLPRGEEVNHRAGAIFDLQFEDIFQGVYHEAVQQLTQEEGLEFRIRAALGIERHSFFLTILLKELIDANVAETRPAFERWITPPDSPVVFSDDLGGVFLLAHLGLARLAAPVPEADSSEDPDSAAWREWGKIVYWLHRFDLEEAQRISNCLVPWRKLTGELLRSAIDPWCWLVRYRRLGAFGDMPIEKPFPRQLRKLLEAGLGVASELTCLFVAPFEPGRRTRTMIGYLGRVGNESTAVFLEQWADSEDFGTEAIKAIREIRSRT